MDIYEITKRLVGPIEPIGDSNIDSIRYENLRETIALTEKLIEEIILVARHSSRSEFSISRAGREANNFINDLRSRLQI